MTPASSQNEGDALGREAGVERHIGGVDLEHRQQRHVGVDGLVEQEADAVARLMPADQVAGDLIGALVELAKVSGRRR